MVGTGHAIITLIAANINFGAPRVNSLFWKAVEMDVGGGVYIVHSWERKSL